MNNTPILHPSDAFQHIAFQYTWRTYQEKFLNAFLTHIHDNHLHVIAPPGSGKTILGIEMLKRVGKKALVFAPTITIRNQWKDRLVEFFTESKQFGDYSFDLKNPALLTFTTYQSLHAFYKSFEDKKEFFQFFETNAIGTIVLDEAHHLKNEWWKCVFELKEKLDATTIALTATPPIDSSNNELARYYKLCGPIDDQIAVPDLIKEGDLCPHQDYIYFSEPDTSALETITMYREKVTKLIDWLQQHEDFISFLQLHRFFSREHNRLKEIYEFPEYFSSILIFLKAVGKEVSKNEYHVLGFETDEEIVVPELNEEWLEILLQHALFIDREILLPHETLLKRIENQLRKKGVIQNKKVRLRSNDTIAKKLAHSSSKLQSIITITKHEYEQLGASLRAVILTDYIRKEFLQFKRIAEVNSLGAIPIFQHLRLFFEAPETIAVLTGSIVIISKQCLQALQRVHDLKNYSYRDLVCDDNFVIIESKTSIKGDLVTTITKLFQLGQIKVLIGTKSLLGEGWDAPSINTLILASFVGSYVSSNQMRGRAIRGLRVNEEKISNIWHLACIDPLAEDGGKDIVQLRRRFDAFVGVSAGNEMIISNGMERLQLPIRFDLANLESLNENILAAATRRNTIRKHWDNAIQKGKVLIQQIQYIESGKDKYEEKKALYFKDVSFFFVMELVCTGLLILTIFSALIFALPLEVMITFGILMMILCLVFGVKMYNAYRIYRKNGFPEAKIQQMAKAVLHTMKHLGYLTTRIDAAAIKTQKAHNNQTSCAIQGVNNHEASLFVNAMGELMQPIDNPRYIITETSFFRDKTQLQNHYALPTIFASKKEDVDVFMKFWEQYVGDDKATFTRNAEGRKLLIKARLKHVKYALKNETKKEIIWK